MWMEFVRKVCVGIFSDFLISTSISIPWKGLGKLKDSLFEKDLYDM